MFYLRGVLGKRTVTLFGIEWQGDYMTQLHGSPTDYECSSKWTCLLHTSCLTNDLCEIFTCNSVLFACIVGMLTFIDKTSAAES